MAQANNDKDHYYAKPPVFDGEKQDYWKDGIKIFFVGFDADLWDMVLDGYTYHVDDRESKLERSKMSYQQKKDHKNHHRSRTIFLNAISQYGYENIRNRDSAKSIFDSSKMTHEGNEQVKQAKSLDLIQKYESFKIEKDAMIEEMFSRFLTLVAGLKVLNKVYTIIDHVKKIIRSLPKKLETNGDNTKGVKGSEQDQSRGTYKIYEES